MNKFLATLLAGVFTLALGSAAFAADAEKSVEPAKAEAVKAAEPAADTKATPAKTTKKHHRKHSKKATEAAPAETATPAAQ